MSRVKEIADAEAEAIEAAEAQDEADADLEASVAAEDADRATDDAPSSQATLDAFEFEVERHDAELRKIMGDDYAAMRPCITCEGLGLIPNVPYKLDPRLVECYFCDGQGYLSNPTKNPMTERSECPVCNGNGYTAKPAEVPAPAPPQAAYPPNGVPGYDAPRAPDLAAPPYVPETPYAPGYVPPPQPLPQRP